jgi:uncharacterized protein YjbI with pentapeptide repeats
MRRGVDGTFQYGIFHNRFFGKTGIFQNGILQKESFRKYFQQNRNLSEWNLSERIFQNIFLAQPNLSEWNLSERIFQKIFSEKTESFRMESFRRNRSEKANSANLNLSEWNLSEGIFQIFLPSADYKVVCRRPWNHFLTHPPTPPDFIEIGYSKVSYDTFLD